MVQCEKTRPDLICIESTVSDIALFPIAGKKQYVTKEVCDESESQQQARLKHPTSVPDLIYTYV